MRSIVAITALCAVALAARAAASHGHENDLARVNVSAVTLGLRADATVALNASVAADGDFVRISVNNPGFAAKGDWIGAYAADADPGATVPLKWTYFDPYIPGYNVSGVGNVTFQVYAIRQAIVFRVFSGGTSKPVLVASSAPLTFADYGAPAHPRVLPGATHGDYVVAWTSNASDGSPRLRWGTSRGGPYPNAAPATAATIPRASLCGAPATGKGFMDLGVTLTAALPGLAASAAGATVFYVMEDDSRPPSREFAFAVPPAPGPTFPLAFAAFGDLGRGSWDDGITWTEYGQPSRSTAQALAEDVAAGRAAFVHHYGDISYAVGYLQVGE